MEIKIYNQLSELVMIAEQWDNLALLSPQKNPQMSHAWLSCFLSVYLEKGQWFVVAAFSGDELLVVLPLVIKEKKYLWIMKSSLHLPRNNQTLSVDAVVKPGMEYLLPKLHAAAFDYCPDATHIAYLRIDQVSANVQYFQRKAELFCQQDLAGYGYALSIQGSYGDYFSSLSKNHKNNIKRWLNKLSEYERVEYKYETQYDESMLNNIFVLEDSGWKGRESTSVYSDPLATEYFRLLAKSLASKGWLELQSLQLNDQVVAGNFSIRFANQTLLWKLAYSEDYANMSPGSLLIMDVIKRSFCQRLDRIDLLTSEKWYKNWKMQKRAFIDVFIFNNRTISGIFFAVYKRVRLHLSALKMRLSGKAI